MSDSIAGFILAGGASRRMGTDKSRLKLEGETFVERIAREIGVVAESVSLVGNQPNSAPKLAQVPDVFPNWGALGGVHAALAACSADWALVVACDFPLVSSELLARLGSFREGHEAVAPIQDDGIPQPLCALYRVKPCLVAAEHMIKSGERKPIALLQSVRTRWVSFAELSTLRGANHFFDNINTPEDYTRVREKGLCCGDVRGEAATQD
jgi:molybdopterin-guanine dinucleotide biosynthesis protein A